MGKRAQIFVAAICIFSLISCTTGFMSSAPKEPDYSPTEKWRTSSPESQGLDSKALSDVIEFILEEKLPIHSLTMIRHGYVVLKNLDMEVTFAGDELTIDVDDPSGYFNGVILGHS